MSELEKLDMKTINFTNENIAKIAEVFPNVVSEGENGKVIDFDALKQELSAGIVDGYKERYSLNWPGKREAQLSANIPTTKTLRPCKEESVNFDNTENLYIEGDNLEVLKILQESYLNKIKMIYIDPPYNTGKDFVYKDNFKRDSEKELLESGQIDEDGGRLVKNLKSDGRYHSDWLSMMYPRLKLARNLLKEDGVMFISIDDNEATNLKKLCDEVFGEQNYVETMYIQVRFANKSLTEKDHFQKLIEQVFVYQKNKFIPNRPYEEYSIDKFCYEIEELADGKLEVIGGKQVKIFTENEYRITKKEASKSLLKETWASGTVLKGNASGKYFDTHLSNRTSIDGFKILYKVDGIGEDGLGFRYFTGPKEAKYTKGKFFSGIPLTRLKEMETGESRKYKPIINFYDFSPDFGNISHEGNTVFRDGKKPTKMLKQFIDMSCNEDDIVLDFFSGSASTAESVFKSNLENHMNRKFILVQIDEKIDESHEYYQAGFKNICELGKERIRRAGKKIVEESGKTDLDIGFRVLKLDSSNMKDVYFSPQETTQDMFDYEDTSKGTVNNIKDDRSELDLLFGVLIDWGVDLTLPITKENIKGKDCYFVDKNNLCACFETNLDEEFIKELANISKERNIDRCVFRDSGFASDSVKDNVSQIFKQLSSGTDIKVI